MNYDGEGLGSRGGARTGKDFQSMREAARAGRLAGDTRGVPGDAIKGGQAKTQSPPGSKDLSSGLGPTVKGKAIPSSGRGIQESGKVRRDPYDPEFKRG